MSLASFGVTVCSATRMIPSETGTVQLAPTCTSVAAITTEPRSTSPLCSRQGECECRRSQLEKSMNNGRLPGAKSGGLRHQLALPLSGRTHIGRNYSGTRADKTSPLRAAEETSTATQHECVEHRNVDTSISAARKTSECDGVQRMRVPSEQSNQTDSTTIDSLERNKHTIEVKLGIQLSNAMRKCWRCQIWFPKLGFFLSHWTGADSRKQTSVSTGRHEHGTDSFKLSPLYSQKTLLQKRRIDFSDDDQGNHRQLAPRGSLHS